MTCLANEPERRKWLQPVTFMEASPTWDTSLTDHLRNAPAAVNGANMVLLEAKILGLNVLQRVLPDILSKRKIRVLHHSTKYSTAETVHSLPGTYNSLNNLYLYLNSYLK
jgi:hypothetical protein